MIKYNIQRSANIFLISCLVIMIIAFIGRKTIYDTNKLNTLILYKMIEELKQCGEGYFFSFLTMRDTIFNKELNFVDQITFYNIDGKLEPASVKFKNQNWGNSLPVDEESYKFLNSKVNGGASYYENFTQLKEISIVNLLLTKSSIKPIKAGFSVVKKYNNIIYVFILTNTTSNNKCNLGKATQILNKLAIATKKLL